MSQELVPFGKYKGKPVNAMLDDRKYMDWLMQQAWFQKQYGNIYQVVINNGQEPCETPEHNAMQIRFLEEEYRLKFACAGLGPDIFKKASNQAIHEWKEEAAACIATVIAKSEAKIDAEYARDMAKWIESRAIAEEGRANCFRCKTDGNCGRPIHYLSEAPKRHQEKYRGINDLNIPGSAARQGAAMNLLTCDPPEFETAEGALDVWFSLYVGFYARDQLHVIDSPYNYSTDPFIAYFPESQAKYIFRIEIKPTIGDDYPAVLRQIKRSKARYLLIREYTGVGATREQFIQFFKTQGITVVFERDVEAAVLPSFDRVITSPITA